MVKKITPRKRMAKAAPKRSRGARGLKTPTGLRLRVEALEGTVRELVQDVNALRNPTTSSEHAQAVQRELGASRNLKEGGV